ncbi:serine/threonine-protein kinase [Streptomyces lutosisoli]|uniref:Serine/threonine-protein kinase n=1 Tax=Streptomyces lutosisoli TaxID=2665721 RepID=A0ABW2VF25_9ACTN
MDPLGPEDPPRIGPYRLIGRLGAGGMGRVYLARSEGGRTVAVKLVQTELAQEPEFRRRFAQEVAAARRVGGAWTAPVLDADTEATTPWVATGYIPGPSLQTVVDKEYGPLPLASVRVLANRLALSLQAIHAAGLVHRDLKPSNILLTVDAPRVIDFGIARALDTVLDDFRTRTGMMIGSPGFMSPEQVRGLRTSPASDVFCLGSVLAFAATGRPPFGTASSGLHALLFRVAEEEPDLAGLPPGIDTLVRDCLRKDPALRPTPAEVAARTEGGAGNEPWLPGALLAGLGRRAAELLDADGPTGLPPAPVPTLPAAVAVPPTADAVTRDFGAAPSEVPVDPGPPEVAEPAERPRRRRTRLIVVAAAAAIVAAIVVLSQLPDDGDGNDNKKGDSASSSSSDPFAGAWEGRLTENGKDARQFIRIEIIGGAQAGEKGETLISVTLGVEQDVLCQGEADIASRKSTELVLSPGKITAAVPADSKRRCALAAEQRLEVDGNGLHLVSGNLSSDLTQATTGEQPVPAAYLGTWKAANPSEVPGLKFSVTIKQGTFGSEVDTTTITTIKNGNLCAYRSILVSATDSLILGPNDSDGCDTGPTHIFTVPGKNKLRREDKKTGAIINLVRAN